MATHKGPKADADRVSPAFQSAGHEPARSAGGRDPRDRSRALASQCQAAREDARRLRRAAARSRRSIPARPSRRTRSRPQAGTKVSKVAALADDLALGLSRKVRIVAPIPGKNRIGFELPNEQRVPGHPARARRGPPLPGAERRRCPCVLGRDIVGAPFFADLASMPHVIVAGATGAGKSVGLNVMLTSLLFRRTPDELRLLMIDPEGRRARAVRLASRTCSCRSSPT